MSAPLAEYIWKNGKIVPWAEATVHVMTHALHYGTGVFEGMRIYDTHLGPAAFRMADHFKRLLTSGKIYGIIPPYSAEELGEATRQLASRNGLTAGYVRPLMFFGASGMAVTPGPDMPVDLVIICFPLGRYLGADAIEQGVDVCVSTWRRPAPSTTPAAAKASGNYLSGVLIGREAQAHGFAEGIALGADGRLSEGAGENLFIVKDGKLLTPPAGAAILFGITRDTVIKLAKDMGVEVVEQSMPREILYMADEIFLTGTAAEITPVRSVDRLQVGEGRRGPITRALQDAFFGLFDGSTEDKRGWLEPIGQRADKRTSAAAE
jgi:branched-chain amino acid aminotransferase